MSEDGRIEIVGDLTMDGDAILQFAYHKPYECEKCGTVLHDGPWLEPYKETDDE